MNVIGIRATPKKIFYSIIEINDECFGLINQDLLIPVSFDVPQKLQYVRKTFLDIFNEYNIIKAGIRITEPFAPSADSMRIMLEGVIQELIASSKVESYFVGIKSSITSKLGLLYDGSITELIEGKQVYNGIENWTKFSLEIRECILIAFASYNN